MAKPKRSSGGSGLRKNHGPKKHLFRELKPMVWSFAKSGLLSKYYAEGSFILACQARGYVKVSHEDWVKFSLLKTTKEKDEYFAALKK